MIFADLTANVDAMMGQALECRDRKAWVGGHARAGVVYHAEEVLAIVMFQSGETVLRTDKRTRWTRV